MTGSTKVPPPPLSSCVSKNGKNLKHHWHEDKRATRSSKPGWVQARCCKCNVQSWAKPKLKKTCRKAAEVKGPSFKAAEVEGR